MKRLVEDVSGDGLEKLLGKEVQLWCMNYIYSGKLVGVNEHDVCIANPHVVYETGELNDRKWKDAEPMGLDEFFVRTSAIEGYGPLP